MHIQFRAACKRVREALVAVGLLFFSTFATFSSADTLIPKSASRPNQPGVENTKQWITDAVVRQGMQSIQRSMSASQAGIDDQRLTTADYQKLAVEVDRAVAEMMKNRSLAKDSDTAFHTVVLADLNWGTEMMRTSPKIEAQRVGALGVLQALRNYGKYFRHPGWPES